MSLTSDSKLLSLILRHAPEKAGLELGEGSWVQVDALLEGLTSIKRPLSRERLEQVVAENDKKRFTLSDDGQKIRAAQGHSVEIVQDYVATKPLDVLYHGTATRFADTIRREGLKPMTRLHVHLSADIETANKVGQRHGKPIIFRVLSKSMFEAGFEFYQADNGVWLTNKVPAKYLKEENEEN